MNYKQHNTYVGPMFLDVDESEEMRQRAETVYEPAKTKMLEHIVESGMVFLDVGVNKGWFSCLASKLIGFDGLVYSFEPMPSNIEWIKKTIELSPARENVMLHEQALGDCDGTTVFTMGRRSGAHTMEYHPTWKGSELTVKVNRWDSMNLIHPDVVKIDVECSELRVLSGMRRLLEQDKRIAFFIDVHTWMGVDLKDVQNVFSHYGFKIHDVLSRCEVVATKGDWNI